MNLESSFNQFFNIFNNQSVEAEDPTNKFQCMDLAFKWCDFIGVPREAIRHLYAYQVWTQPNDVTRKFFELVPNVIGDPNSKPPVGSLVIFGQNVGPAGHISIGTKESDGNNVVSFDQNWDTAHYYRVDSQGNHIPYSRKVTHYNYSGVLGWLVPKPQTLGDDVLINKIKSIVDGSASPHDKIDQIKQLLNS